MEGGDAQMKAEDLEKLVEKATPKKVKETENMFACPECGQMLSMKYPGLCIECIKSRYYCPNCGQKLDWSEV